MEEWIPKCSYVWGPGFKDSGQSSEHQAIVKARIQLLSPNVFDLYSRPSCTKPSILEKPCAVVRAIATCGSPFFKGNIRLRNFDTTVCQGPR